MVRFIKSEGYGIYECFTNKQYFKLEKVCIFKKKKCS